MRADCRTGAAGYLEVFILIGVAIGGSGIVLGAATSYSSAMQGPSISVSDVSLTQGAYFAVERLTLTNTGQVSFSSFSVTTLQVPTSASYCYTLTNPSTLLLVASTCPSLTADPRTVAVAYNLSPGASLALAIQVPGTVYTVGSQAQVAVLTSAGASASIQAQVLPA